MVRKKDPLLFWTSKMMKLFIPVMAIGAVSNPSFKTGMTTNDKFICHSFCMLQPRKWCMDLYKLPKKVKDSIYDDMKAYEWEDLIQDVWTLEGTNFVNPYVLPNKILFDLEEIKAYVSKNDRYIKLRIESICKKYKSFNGATIEANHPESNCDLSDLRKKGIPFSNFYKNVINIWTDFFAKKGHLVTDFTAFTQKNGISYYGPNYDEFISKGKNVEMKPTFNITVKEWVEYMDIIEQQPPFDMPIIREEETVIPELERLKNKYKKTTNTRRRNEIHSNDLHDQLIGAVSPPYVAFRLNHVSKITSSLLKEIEYLLNDPEFKFYGFDYLNLPIVPNGQVSLIELRFHH